MNILKWLFIAVVALVLAAIAAGQLGFLQGQAPTDLGVRDGKLKPPSSTPNSVSSQAALYPDHPMREQAAIAPLPSQGDAAATMARVKAVVESMPGAKVVRADTDYLYAQFTTRLMKYVDDVEFWFDPAAQGVQVRSASRLGKGDMGANRARIEAIRSALGAASSPAAGG